MKVKIREVIDYSFRQNGDRCYYLVDLYDQYVPNGGCWKYRKSCMGRLKELGYEYAGTYTVHQNYSGWQDFQPERKGKRYGKRMEA